MPSASGETSAVPGLLQRIRQLERDLEGLQGEVQKYCAKHESIQKQLAEKAKVTVQLWGMRRRAGRYLGCLAGVYGQGVKTCGTLPRTPREAGNWCSGDRPVQAVC